jgi:hypothetical protein
MADCNSSQIKSLISKLLEAREAVSDMKAEILILRENTENT